MGRMADVKPLVTNRQHLDACHKRWLRKTNRYALPVVGEQPDEWSIEQCGQCAYYLPVTGVFGSDWGVCSNEQSEFDGRAMFEHDGCDAYTGATEWVTSYLNFIRVSQRPPTKR